MIHPMDNTSADKREGAAVTRYAIVRQRGRKHLGYTVWRDGASRVLVAKVEYKATAVGICEELARVSDGATAYTFETQA